MPRFYFHIRDGEDLIRDLEGSDLPDLTAAQSEAAEAARQMQSRRVLSGEAIDDRYFEIADEAGETLAVLQMRSVVKLS